MSEDLDGGAPAPAESTAVSEAPVTQDAQQINDDVREELGAVWDRMQAEDEPSDSRPRAEDGKFIKTKSPVADALAPKAEEPAAETTSEGSSPETETSETAAPSIAPPASLPSEMKAKFATLPPDVQEYWAKRESESHAKITQLGQQAKQYEPIARVVEQYKDTFDRYGLTYDAGIARLLAAQRSIENDPHTAINNLARQYGVTLSGEPSTQVAPEVSQLQQHIARLEAQIRETQTKVVSREQQEQVAQRNQILATVDQFAKSKPDYDILEPYIEKAVRIIKADNPELSPKEALEKAYEEAVWLHPEVREKRIAEQAAKRAEEERKAAEKASKVAKLNVKTTASAKPGQRSFREDLEATYDDISRRAG